LEDRTPDVIYVCI